MARSKGANISDSTFQVFSIKGKNKEENEYLIDSTSMLLSEALTPIKPIFSQDDYQNSGFSWGQISPSKSRIIDVYNYEENTDFQVEYVIESPPSYEYKAEDVADSRNVSIQIRYSFIEMPENDFEPRIANQSIGYFSEKITDLSSTDVTPYKDLIGKWTL